MYQNVDISFWETVDQLIVPALEQRGSKLLPYVVNTPVIGASTEIRQQEVGEARKVEGRNALTTPTPIEYDKRRLYPEAYYIDIRLDNIDIIRQGPYDPGVLANQASNKLGKVIDDVIIHGLGGGTYSVGGKKYIPLPGAKEAFKASISKEEMYERYLATQTIPWNDAVLLGGDLQDYSLVTLKGLSSSKINRAVQMLRSKYAGEGPLILVCSSYAQMSMMADKIVRSTLTNFQPAMASGQLNPFGGVDQVVVCERVDHGKSAIKNDGSSGASLSDGVDVEYAYVFAMEHIRFGSNLMLKREGGQDVNRLFNPVMNYLGMYDCIRMFEEAVVRIEIYKGEVDENREAFIR